MQERHARVADAAARLLVDQLQAGVADGAERRVDVVAGVGHVVQARAVAGDELADAGILGEGLDQLDVAVADLEQNGLDALLLDRLAVLLAHVELLRVEPHGGVDVRHRDAYVVDPPEEHEAGQVIDQSPWGSDAAMRGTSTGPWCRAMIVSMSGRSSTSPSSRATGSDPSASRWAWSSLRARRIGGRVSSCCSSSRMRRGASET